MIRAIDRETIFIPASDGEPVEIRIQGFQLRTDAGADGAEFALPPLFFGNGREVEGAVWKEKARTKLIVEKK